LASAPATRRTASQLQQGLGLRHRAEKAEAELRKEAKGLK
jgi:hypothetical protein